MMDDSGSDDEFAPVQGSLKAPDWVAPAPVPIVLPEKIKTETDIKHPSKVRKLAYTKSHVSCSRSFDELIIYGRPEFRIAYEFLAKRDITRAMREGPPGAGKSVVAWYYALNYSREAEVCWVDVKNGKVLTLKDEVITMTSLNSSSDLRGHLLVLDGVTHQDADTRFRACIQDIGRPKLLIVSSLQFRSTRVKDFQKHTTKAWTLDEYYMAIENDSFFAQVLENLLYPSAIKSATYSVMQRRKLIDQKYRLAGHSARFMFDISVDAVCREINHRVDWVKDYDATFTRSAGYHQSLCCRSSLLITDLMDEYRTIFMSDYVARRLAARYPHSIRKFRNLVQVFGDNNAMQGQAFEAEFLFLVKRLELMDCVKYIKEDKRYPDDVAAAARTRSAQEMEQGDAEGDEQEEEDDVESDDEVLDPAASGSAEIFSGTSTSAEEHKGDISVAAAAPAVSSVPAGAEQAAAPTRIYEDEADACFNATEDVVEYYNQVLDKGFDISTVTDNVWMIPVVPDLGGFDCVKLCVRPNHAPYLLFVQLTVRREIHAISLNYMRTFLQDFNQRRDAAGLSRVQLFEVVVVLPSDIALFATSPSGWKVTGLPRAALRCGHTKDYSFHFRVAGYFPSK